MNKVWGIDFDSTINDMAEYMCKTLTLVYNCPIKLHEVDSWGFWNDHPLADLIWSEHIYHNREWTLDIPPRLRALQVIFSLIDRGDKVLVITDREAKDFDVVRTWLNNHGLSKIPLLLTDKKKSKAALAAQAGCTDVIEDSPHWIEMYTHIDSVKNIYVMDYMYNMDLPDDKRIVRIRDWRELDAIEFDGTWEEYDDYY